MIGTLWQDLRYGVRMLLRKPGFTIVAVLTLALGIGANTAIFSVVNGVLLRALPYPDADRLVMLWEANSQGRSVHVSHRNFNDWREQSQSFDSISAYSGRFGGPSTIMGGSEPVRAKVVGVYRDFFNVFDVKPFAGRVFMPEESDYGTSPVAVVSYGFWQSNLNSDLNLTDKKLTIGSHSYQVIGVMPKGFSFPEETAVWISKEQLSRDTSERSSHNFAGIARLKSGVSLAQAQAEMTAIGKHIVERDSSDADHEGVAVIALKDQLTGAIRPALLVLMAAVGLVLLIACANVANLLLARAIGRQKEVAIRTALGASRLRIVRQLLTESLLLSLVGGALAALFAYWLLSALVAIGPTTIPRLSEIGIDGRSLGFTFGTALLTSMLFGLMPALRASRPNLNEVLKEGGRGSSSSTGFFGSMLVVAEIAMTLVLLTGTGLLVKSLWQVWQINPGFNPNGMLTMQVALPDAPYAANTQAINFYKQLLSRTQALSGVESGGMINNLPLGGVDINGMFYIAGRPDEHSGYASFRVTSPDYFQTMEIALVKGRYFTEQDNETAEPVAIISKRVADATFKDEDPIGQRVMSVNDLSSVEEKNQLERWPKIVGVVDDVKHFGLEGRNSADLYVCYMQRPMRIREMTVILRTTGESTGLAAAVRQEVKDIDTNLPVSFDTMEQLFLRSTANRRYQVILLAAFAVLGLGLAMIGVYGVMSYAVSQSRRELGIRMALGAQALDILKLVIGQGMALTAVGLGIGIVAAFALTRLMASLLYEVTATDPLIFASVSMLLTIITLLACYIPARRATKVDPMMALRHD
jgi:putative ABC transport system permease protein